MPTRPSLLHLPLCLTLALAGAACGDGHDHGEHGHGMEPDGGYPDVPCDPNLPPLAVGLAQVGAATMTIKATLVSSDPIPLLKGSADWVVDFTTLDGTPVTDFAFIDARTLMPVHGHRGPFNPKVKALPEPGRYEFDGLTFNMRGPWQIRMEVESPTAGDDYVIFDVCVEPEVF